MPGILKTEAGSAAGSEKEGEGEGEGERLGREGTAKGAQTANGAAKEVEIGGREREGSCGGCSSPDADLNNSSSTLASSDGDSDSKNEDTLSSLDNPLPNGMDQNSRDKNKQEAGIKGSDNCTSGSGTASGSGSLGSKAKKTQTSEIATISLRLVLPGVPQPVEVTMSSKDTVHDLSQLLLEKPESCYRTCTSAWHNKKRLDDFCELGAVDGLKQGDIVELVEEPYTQKDIRIHLQRLRELLTISPFNQSLTNADGMSLSLLASITLKEQEEIATRPCNDFVDLSQLEPPPYCLSQDGTTPLSAFYPPAVESHFKVPECVKLVAYSQWNPPPSHRRMKGDLLYLDVLTLEGVEHYVTACPSGFYLNRSTARDAFDPTPRKSSHHSTHLVGLLSVISPLFKKNFALLQKFGEKRHPYELLPISYPLYPWLSPKPEHRTSPFRLNDGMQLKGAPDEVIMGQMRDWNEELQSARELPVDTPQLKIFRERTLYKIHWDLVQVATRGAMLVVDGFIPALNPGDEEKFRMFLWNNLFFSLAFDGRDHYRAYGGDEAAHAAASGDLHGVEMFERLETKGLYTLQTVVVDYRGYRVVCQSIVPGLLWREQEAAVMYGSIDGGKTIGADPAFSELLKEAAMDLHIRPHKLRTEAGEVVELPSSLEVKGILGTDNRHYALDLFRIFPPDPNYTKLEDEGEKEGEGKGEKEGGYRHKLAVLRPELLETFLQYRYLLFLKLAKEKACKLQVIQSLHQVFQKDSSEQSPSQVKSSDHSTDGTTTSTTDGTSTATTDGGATATMDSTTTATTDGATTATTDGATTATTDGATTATTDGATTATTESGATTTTTDGPTTATMDGAATTTTDSGTTATMDGATTTTTDSGTTTTMDGATTTTIDSGTTTTMDGATTASTDNSSVSTEHVERSDSHASMESRQADHGHNKCQNTSPNSNSNVSSPSSNPGTKCKLDITSSRFGKGGVVGVGRGNMSILSALGDDGGVEGSEGVSGGKGELGEGGRKEELAMSGAGAGEVLLVDGLQLLVEEKEVEPEAIPGADLLTSANDHTSQTSLDKGLSTSDILKSHPEVMEALQEAALEAGSVGGEEFDIRFNVDAFSPGVSHADPPEVLERDRNLLREAVAFLTDIVVPRMVRECVQLSLVPTDGESLKTAMHSRGVNMRYLGRVATLASSREDLEHLKRLSVCEMVVRVARRRVRKLLQETPYEKVSEAIVHFLNCFLGQTEEGGGGGGGGGRETGEDTPVVNGHTSSKKKQKKKKSSKGPCSSDWPHFKITPSNLWSHIVGEVKEYYKYTLEQSSLVEMCSQLGVQRVILLGELCKKTGIQMVAQDYDFTSRTPFTDEDIASLFPIVKHTHFRSTECTIMFELAQTKFSAGSFRTAHDLYMEALQMFIQIYGPLHINVANCYRQVAKINYMVGEAAVALSFQHKAVLVYERVLGVDHPETLSSYINLAIYCHNTNQTAVALRLMYRARYLLTVMCGEDHPEVATCDCNIALMLHGFRQYESSLRFLENSLRVFEKYHGKQSLQAALTHHLKARVQSFMGDFRAALANEKCAYTIYNNKFGSDHERTKESSECLKDLTQKAVTMQKTINEMTGKGKGGAGGRVLVDLPGSWGDVASMINASDPTSRHLPRGQKPIHSKTHVVRRRNRSSKQQQQQQQSQQSSLTTKLVEKQTPPTAVATPPSE